MENINWGELPFGYFKTDYNVRCYYKNGEWGEIEVSSSEYINIHIAATALHYGQECFEGMKVFRGKDGKIRVFRWEENAKRKKIAKKKLKNIITSNTKKIQEIEQEIIPFKDFLNQVNPTFENIVRKLDEFEAERISVKDSLALLETRYKRGRLPSRAAYLKLYDNFVRRQRKVDRSIDKLIQQLRSYLL